MVWRRSWALGTTAIVVTSAVSCSSDTSSVAISRAAHTERELVWSGDPHQWVDVERAAFDVRRGETTAPDEHTTVRRIQAWVDRYDTTVRAIVRQQEGRDLVAARPAVRLVIDRDVNASVSTVPACITPLAPRERAVPSDTSPLVLMRGRRLPSSGAETTCFESRTWSRESGLAWFNALGGMQVRAGDAGFVVGGAESTSLRAAQVAIASSAPFVNINTGLVTSMSENGIAIVLAHELAHYYRAHLTTSVEDKYAFWFDRDEVMPARPLPVADQEEYRREYLRLRLPRFLVPGQRYHPRVATTLLRWIKDMVPASGHVCERAVAMYRKLPTGVRSDLDSDAVGALSPSARAAYRELERAVVPCIDTVVLTDASEIEGDGLVSTSSLPRAWFVRRIAAELRSEGTEISRAVALRDLVATLEAAARRLDDEASTFVKRLLDNHIGLYTHEQEADEIAMELAAKVGITPDQVMAGFSELMYAVEAPDPATFAERYGITADECAALARARFRANGKRVYVPLGRLGDPHHAYCYRLFNLDRERDAHDYVVGPPVARAAVPWTEVQAAAESLMATGRE
ncbi:MAG TPA: M48 family metalloprotease [Labilithrix sp.]|nr:M48 family metalloprotease [Labilithrix sp.]